MSSTTDNMPPPPPATQEELVEAGLKQMRAVVDGIEIAQDKAAMVALITGWLSPEHREAVTAALRTEAGKALAIQIRSSHGLKGPLDGVLELLAESTAPGGALLDGLTKKLGVKGLHAPPGYTVAENGVFGEGIRVSQAPVLITGVARDVHTGAARIELAWRHGKRWVREWVDRGEAMDSRRAVRLADHGAPVNSDNARDLVRYLAAFEEANLAFLPTTTTTSRLGWHGSAFVLPDVTFGGAEPITVTTAGAETLLQGYESGGTWEGWCAGIQSVLDQPRAVLAIIASAAAPILHILRQQGFIVDWSGETSIGKTSTLRLAASVWGLPDDEVGIIMSWASSSSVGPMAAAAFYCHLPVIIDDTKRAKREVCGQFLYDLPAGRDKLRGTITGGLQNSRHWRTIGLTTGEAPITSFAPDGAGAHARAIVLRGSPIEGREMAETIKAEMLSNYGHLGRRLAARLTHMNHEELSDRFDELRTARAELAKTAVQGRMAAYVAVLELALELMYSVGFPTLACDPIRTAWESVVSGGSEADRAAEAMARLQAWCAANQSRFDGREPRTPYNNQPVRPPGGYVGAWDHDTAAAKWKYVGIIRAHLEGLLREWQCDVHGVLEAWRGRGWLLGDRRGDEVLLTKTVRIDGAATRVIAIKREFFDVPP